MKKDDKKSMPIGQVCNIDNLGRIVIPSLMRKAYNLEKSDAVELIMDDGGILMRKYQPGCVFCGNIRNISMYKGQIICEDCMDELKKD